MANMIKTTCTRCGGSGKFSFNLIKGTVCFGCDGIGYKMVDEKNHAATKLRKEKADAKQKETCARRMKIANEVRQELDAKFGPFADTELGAYNRMIACQINYKKTPGDIVNERMKMV